MEIRSLFKPVATGALLGAGMATLAASSAQAQCAPFNFVPGVRAVQRFDTGAEITRIGFRTGAEAGGEPRVDVYFTVDGVGLQPFEPVVKLGINFEDLQVGPGQTAGVRKCFLWQPGNLTSAGPFRASFRLSGFPADAPGWGGVLPAGTYSATVDVGLRQGGLYYRDFNMDDNSSNLTEEYKTDLVAEEVTIEGKRRDREVTMTVKVHNAGSRPCDDDAGCEVKWWTQGIFQDFEATTTALFPAGETSEISYTFNRFDDVVTNTTDGTIEFIDDADNDGVPIRSRFGPVARVIVQDALGIERLNEQADIEDGSSTPPPDPEPIPLPEPDPPPPPAHRHGANYVVRDVVPHVLDLGAGEYLLLSSVRNRGCRRGRGGTSRVRWTDLTADGQYTFVPVTRRIRSRYDLNGDGRLNDGLAPYEVRTILARLNTGADDPNLRATSFGGKLTVDPPTNEIRPANNTRAFDLELEVPEVEEPIPPEIVLAGAVETGVANPEYADEDGGACVAVQLRNNGGPATSVEWDVRIDGLERSDGGEPFVDSNVGTGACLPQRVVQFTLKAPTDGEGNGDFVADDSDEPRVFRGSVSGTTKFCVRGEEVAGPSFEFPVTITVEDHYPRAELQANYYVHSGSQYYSPAVQYFQQEDSNLEVIFSIHNNGSIGVNPDRHHTATMGIEGYKPLATHEFDGLERGEYHAHLLTMGIDCDYWKNHDDKDFESEVDLLTTERNQENNHISMGLAWGPPELNLPPPNCP